MNCAPPGRKSVQYNEKYFICIQDDPNRYQSTLDDEMLVVFTISETKKKWRAEAGGQSITTTKSQTLLRRLMKQLEGDRKLPTLAPRLENDHRKPNMTGRE